MTDTTITPARQEPAAPERTRRSPGQWLRDRSGLEIAVWIGLLVVAIVLRTYDLGSRPFHHDESQDAYFAYNFSKDFGDYKYNPLLHGPLRFYLTALNYKLFGDSNFTARLAPATMGLLAVGLPYLLRHQLGRVAAFGAAVILAIGPSFLFFSRFAREDIYLAAITLAMFVAAFRFLARPRTVTLCLLAALVAMAYATKESGIVIAGLGGVYFLLAILVQGVREQRIGRRFVDGEVMTAVRAVGWVGWVYAIAVMVIVYGALFTSFFTNVECQASATEVTKVNDFNCITAIYDGIDYWRSQQELGRGDDKGWLYASIIFGNEWPALLLAAVGVLTAFRRPTTLRLFLVFMFVAVLAFHWWGRERFAWLVIHPLLPMILLSGIGLQTLWQLRSRIARGLAFAGVALGAVYMVGASYSANAKQGADPRNLLVATQSSYQVRDLVVAEVERLDRAAKAAGRSGVTITIDSSEGATFPYAWYFRDKEVGYIDMTTEGYVPNTEVLVMTETSREALKPNLAAYQGRKFDFRVWWVKDYKKKFSASAWWDWLTERKPWNETGGMKEWFYVRTDAQTP